MRARRRFHKYFIILAAAAALATGALTTATAQERAPEPPPPEGDLVSLGAVLEVAVRQSPALELASIDVQIADAALLEARGVDDWILGASAAWMTQRFVDLGLTDLQHQVNVDVDLTRPLSTGGSVTVGAAGSYSERRGLYTEEVAVGVFQPLLRGRGSTYARANIARAEIARGTADLEGAAEANQVVRQVVDAYWELSYSLRDLEIRRSSLELAIERLRITRAGIEGGAVAPTEALAVEQAIASREVEVLSAEVAVAERSIELRRIAGMEIGPGEINLTATAAPTTEAAPLDLDALLAAAYAQSPEIAVLEKRREGAELEVEVTENGLLPRLDFRARFGPVGIGEGPGDAARNLITFDDLSFSASLDFQQALGQRAARGQVAGQRARLYRVRVTLEDLRAQTAAAMVRAVKNTESAQKRIEISQRAIVLSEKNIEAEQARFELGRSTNFDVLQRQEELKLAQLRYARAVVDYLRGLNSIEALTGGLLDRYGITLQPRRNR